MARPFESISVALGLNPREFDRGLARAGRNLTGFGKSVALGVTAPVAALGGLGLKAAIEFESSFAGVRKTVDGTAEELAGIQKQLESASETRLTQTTSELFQIAEAAGQLGIKTQNVANFAETMAMLGETTNLSADDAATSLARFANITGASQDTFDRLGSSIVDLGNNFATTEAEIAAMALRLAGAGDQVGLSEAEILGFSAALSSVGIEAEAGGTAISRVFIELANAVASGSEKLDDFASVAGSSVADFSEKFKTDAAGAIADFIEGLGRVRESGGNVFATLEQLGLENVRVRDALLRTSGAADLLRRSLDLSENAYEQNTALTAEFSKRMETTAAQLKLLRNQASAVARQLGQALLPGLIRTVAWLKDLASVTKDVLSRNTQLILGIGGVLAVMGPAIIALGTLTNSIRALGVALAWVAANPLVAILGALAAAAVGFIGFHSALNLTRRSLDDLQGGLEDTGDEGSKLTKTIAELEERLRAAEKSLQWARDVNSTVGVKNATENITELNEKLAESEAKLSKVRAAVAGAFQQMAEDFEMGREKLGEFASATDISKIRIDAYREALRTLHEVQGENSLEIEYLNELLAKEQARLETLIETQRTQNEIQESTTALIRETSSAYDEFLAKMEDKDVSPAEQVRTASDAWGDFKKSIEVTSATLVDAFGGFVKGSVSTFSRGIGQMVAYGEDFGDVMDGVWRQILATGISTLVQLGIEWVLSSLLAIGAGSAQNAAQMANLAGQVYLGSFAATAMIPVIGPIIAPAVASSATAIALSGALAAGLSGGAVGATISKIGAGLGAIAGYAEGGIVMEPTLAWIAEGGEPEAVVPLSKLSDLIPRGGRSITANLYVSGRQLAREVIHNVSDEVHLFLGPRT